MHVDEFTDKVSWGHALSIRIKKLYLDLTSAKVWVLGFVLYGIYNGVSFDPWFYMFASVILGLKDMNKIILAFRGVKS